MGFTRREWTENRSSFLYGLQRPVKVRELAELLAKRIPALLRRRGLDTTPSDEEESDRLARDQPWLSEVYAASVCGRIATGSEAGRRVAVGGDRVDRCRNNAAGSVCFRHAGSALNLPLREFSFLNPPPARRFLP